MGRLYLYKGCYVGETSEGQRIYVAQARMGDAIEFAFNNNVDMNVILDADTWIFSLPVLEAKDSYRMKVLKRLWGDKLAPDIEEQEDTGVYIGDWEPGYNLFELFENYNSAILDTPDHRFIAGYRLIAKRPAIWVKVYKPTGEHIKEHKYSSWASFYAGMCANYEDFKAHEDWYFYSGEEVEE